MIASWALSSFTQTRYDLRDEKVHAMTKEEELGMKKGRRKFDVREEYFVRRHLHLSTHSPHRRKCAGLCSDRDEG